MADIEMECGCEGVLWFTWTIAHLDVAGRIHGDPDLLKAQVCPRLSGVTPELIRSAAGKALEIGLIDIYEVAGDIYIQYLRFDENQIGLRKDREQKSDIPPPSGVTPEMFRRSAEVAAERLRSVAGVTPECCRSNSGATPGERKGREEKRKERNGREGGAALRWPDAIASTADLEAAVAEWGWSAVGKQSDRCRHKWSLARIQGHPES